MPKQVKDWEIKIDADAIDKYVVSRSFNTKDKVRKNKVDLSDLEQMELDSMYPSEDDPINPDYYKVGGIESIDVIEAKLTPEEFRGFLKGTALKYQLRGNWKENGRQDYEKAQWYIDRLLNADTKL
jgi:hypothetical protein